jgi:pimeloyl-ACP methyl ester carboxylesterase
MFAIRHPREVAGLVLVDARHEHMDEITTTQEVSAFYDAVDGQGRTYEWARRLGVVRFFGSSLAGGPRFPTATRSAMALLATQSNAIAATSAEARGRAANDDELQAANLGDRPLIVLISGQSLAGIPNWNEAQRRQSALSSHSQTRIAEGSSHCIQCDDPGFVTEAVGEMVADLRARP